jgi:hypothetical protein
MAMRAVVASLFLTMSIGGAADAATRHADVDVSAVVDATCTTRVVAPSPDATEAGLSDPVVVSCAAGTLYRIQVSRGTLSPIGLAVEPASSSPGVLAGTGPSGDEAAAPSLDLVIATISY